MSRGITRVRSIAQFTFNRPRFVLFVQSYLLNRQSDPGAASNASVIVANFLLQFFLELICDTVCLYVEDTKLKAFRVCVLRFLEVQSTPASMGARD